MTDSDAVHAVLDVGGTSIKVGAVTGGEVATADSVPTRAAESAPIVIAQLQQALDHAVNCARRTRDAAPDGIAVAFPGPFDLDGGRALLRGLGKFDSIHGVDLRSALRTPDVPLVFVRDSEAVGVGEAAFGAGVGVRRVLTIALGTGFGSCLTHDAAPVAEVGGQVIESLHELSSPEGRVDDTLSASGLASQLGLTSLELGPCLVEGRLSSEQQATLDSYGHRLGRFLAGQRHLGVDLVVVAGGLAGSLDRFGDTVRSHLGVPLASAALGAGGPLLGAVQLAFGRPAATTD